MAIAEVNGVALRYEVSGAGPPLVLVHGSWDSHAAWHAAVPPLASRHTVVTYDRRGHSGSAAPGGGTVLDDADDLAALIEQLGLAPAHVAANSLGGNVAMRLAARRPELLRTLALHEPPAFDVLRDDADSAEPLAGLRELMRAVGSRLAAGEAEEGARLFADEIVGPGTWDEMPPEARAGMVENAGTFLDELGDPDAMGADLAALARFRRPALLTSGETPFPLFDRVAERLAAALPAAERRVLPGAGHEPHLTAPQRYAATLTGFTGDA